MPKISMILASMMVACASTQSPQVEHEPTPIESDHKMVNPLDVSVDDDDGMQVEGTLGTLDQGAIQDGLQDAIYRINSCFNNAQRLRPYIGGRLSFKFRVNRDGTIKNVDLQHSTVGVHEVNRCAVEAVSGAKFERPQGGEAEFEYGLDFKERVQPLVWNEDMIDRELDEKRDAILKSAAQNDGTELVPPAGLTITMYLDRRGKATAAGLTAIEPVDDDFADRFIASLKQVTFPRPPGVYAKVSFSW